MSSSGTPLI